MMASLMVYSLKTINIVIFVIVPGKQFRIKYIHYKLKFVIINFHDVIFFK